MSEPQLRPFDEIQAAHDRLVAILTGEVPYPVEDHTAINAAADVLCWVLCHDHNHAFADNLKKIDAFLATRGFKLRRQDIC